MPLVAFTKEITDDAALLATLAPETLQEFCGVALQNIQTGAVSQKNYNKTAGVLCFVNATVHSLPHLVDVSHRSSASGSRRC